MPPFRHRISSQKFGQEPPAAKRKSGFDGLFDGLFDPKPKKKRKRPKRSSNQG